MLTYDAVMALGRALRDTDVLSVYIAGARDDLAQHRAWRVDLEHGLADQRRRFVDASAARREAFDTAVRQLEAMLTDWSPPPRGRGWVAFITADGVAHADALPTSVGTHVAWRRGVLAAPYVKALEVGMPVLCARVDARSATLYRVHDDDATAIESWANDRPAGEAPHLGDVPRTGFHAGTRGRTAHDAFERSQREAAVQLAARVAERIAREAGSGWVVFAGTERVAQLVIDRLPPAVAARARFAVPLHEEVNARRLVDLSMRTAAELRDAEYVARLRAIEDAPIGRGKAARGDVDTTRALEHGQVDELFLSPRFVDAHPDASELAVHTAFDQGARVHVVDGACAPALERLGGIAAVLRYPMAGTGVA
jgi:hypothetical protein